MAQGWTLKAWDCPGGTWQLPYSGTEHTAPATLPAFACASHPLLLPVHLTQAAGDGVPQQVADGVVRNSRITVPGLGTVHRAGMQLLGEEGPGSVAEAASERDTDKAATEAEVIRGLEADVELLQARLDGLQHDARELQATVHSMTEAAAACLADVTSFKDFLNRAVVARLQARK